MGKVLITEQQWLPAWKARSGEAAIREVLREAQDVASHGLSHDEFIAVVDADLGAAGIVNGNRRIYVPARFVAENAALNHKAQAGEFIAAEAGHPEGLPTFNVAAKIVSVECVDAQGNVIQLEAVESEGRTAFRFPEGVEAPPVAKARGKLAFLRTSEGQDLWCCYRAGMELGTSSRSFGIPVPHKLEGDSPYLEANPDHEGETVDVIEGQELITYDIVTVPSAGTFLQSAPREALEAFEHLTTGAQRPPPEDPMNMLEWLKKNAPELLAAVEAHEMAGELKTRLGEATDHKAMLAILAGANVEAAAEPPAADPLAERIAALPADARRQLETILPVVEGAKPEPGQSPDDALLSKIGAVVDEKVGGLRERLVAAEEKARTEAAEKKALAEKVGALEQAAADRARRDRVGAAFEAALESTHKNLRAHVRKFLEGQIADGGHLADAKDEDIAAEVKRVAEAFGEVSTATAEGGAAVPGGSGAEDAPGEDAPGGDGEATNEGADESGSPAALFGEDWLDGLHGMVARH